MKRIATTAISMLLIVTMLVGCAPKTSNNTGANPFAGQALADILENIYAGVTVDLPMLFTTEITAETETAYLGTSGLDMKEAIASESMIGAIAYSVCLVRMNEGADTAAAAKDIKANVNAGKWICVQVDPANVLVETAGDVVVLIMSNDYATDIQESFLALASA